MSSKKRKISTDIILTLPVDFWPETYIKNLSPIQRLVVPEWCGIFYDNNGHLESIHDTIGEKSKCITNTKRGYAIMWHTHPGKFYPSFADIRFLYISNCYRLSIIYSIQGTWILQKEKDVEIDENKLIYYTLCELKMYKISENERKVHEFIKNEYIPMLQTVFGIKAIFSVEYFSKQIILENINPFLLDKEGVESLKFPNKVLQKKIDFNPYLDLTVEELDSILIELKPGLKFKKKKKTIKK